MFLPITTLSTLVLCGLLINLSARVYKFRRKHLIVLGAGDNKEMEFRIRAHANLIEYAPLGLFLILLAEIQTKNVYLLIVLGLLALAFVVGRLIHGYAFSYKYGELPKRILGMQLTLFPMIGLCLLNLIVLLIGFFE